MAVGRALFCLSLAACIAEPRRPAGEEALGLVRQSDDAVQRSDWPAARRALEQAALLEPGDPVVILRRARIELEAYGDVERAEALYLSLGKELSARALHGLGRCALWRGEEERALRLFRDSLAALPTATCARDLAVRLIARGGEADDVLDLVEEISGETLRSRLLLAAAGRRPRPERMPQGWTYGLARARLLPPAQAAAEVETYLDRACATPRARARMQGVLAGDFALQRNPGAAAEVK